jgi:two-component system NarL family response regulator
MSIKVLLVEDDEVFRIGLTVSLRQSKALKLVGIAEDGRKGLDMVERFQPDVVLMDLGLPVLNGVDATEIVKKRYLKVKVLVLTSHSEPKLVDHILNAGVDGFCLKGISTERLVKVIEDVYAGNFWIDTFIADQVKQKFLTPAATKEVEHRKIIESIEILTEREQEVLYLISQGRKNHEIAEQLCISPGTVRVHVHAILHKLHVKDRTQAALYVVQRPLGD